MSDVDIPTLMRERLRKRRRMNALSMATVLNLARSLMPVGDDERPGARGVWLGWILTVEAAMEDESLATTPAFHHAMSRLLCVLAVCIALDDDDVAGTIQTMLALRIDPTRSRAERHDRWPRTNNPHGEET